MEKHNGPHSLGKGTGRYCGAERGKENGRYCGNGTHCRGGKVNALYRCEECEYFGILHYIADASEECHDTDYPFYGEG
jgi:hypothetical protein